MLDGGRCSALTDTIKQLSKGVATFTFLTALESMLEEVHLLQILNKLAYVFIVAIW